MNKLIAVLILIIVLSVGSVNAQIANSTSTPTATSTSTPTLTSTPNPTATVVAATQTPYVITATPSPSPTPNAPQGDAYEPNNTAGTATYIAVPSQLEKLNFYPQGDLDYFRFTIKPSQAGLTLTLDTYTDVGIDTVLGLSTNDGTQLASNDDYSPTDPRSHLAVKLGAGEYMVAISNRAPTRAEFKTYRFELKFVEPSVSNPPTIQPVEQPTHDQFEGKNFMWDTAALIAIGAEYNDLNFICPSWETATSCIVADFYTLPVKQGICYTAETNVSPGVDTNLIVYNEQRDSVAPLTGNDDKGPAEFGSTATWCSTYHGIAYLLIGQVGNKPPPPPMSERTYSLIVSVWLTPTVTPQTSQGTATSGGVNPTTLVVPATPVPNNLGIGSDTGTTTDASNLSPVAIPPDSINSVDEPLTGVIIQEIRPDQIEQPTIIPQIVATITAVVCFDRNANQACDIDEGIAGVSMYVSNANSGDVLAQGITDQDGRVQLTIRTPEQTMLSVSVPMFASVQQVAAQSSQTRPIIVKASANLPALIP